MSEQHLKLRTIFFTHYWGQKVLQITSTQVQEVKQKLNWKDTDFTLLLKPLSSISDEDCLSYIDFCEIIGEKLSYNPSVIQSKIELAKWRIENCFEQLSISEYDYLRSKGYAIPFMQYSVKNLVEMGWVELS
jgi:hypothetical protein